ncbi:MAG: ATP-dependent zinc metalloprotease FtsH [Deltaproteobacteria bacterium]|nr:ATP-dependent zinc metalloprotease FtsH [Deltaproteobacteria bacterium]
MTATSELRPRAGLDTEQKRSRTDGKRLVGPPPPPRNAWLWFLTILVIGYSVARQLAPGADDPTEISYTFFRSEVGRNNVESVHTLGEILTGRFVSPVHYPPLVEGGGEEAAKEDRRETAVKPVETEKFTLALPSFVDPNLESYLIEHGVEITAESAQEGGVWWSLFFSFAPLLVIVAFYVWIYRRATQAGSSAGGVFGLGRSKARRFDKESEERVTFDDVAGIDEAENELVEVVDFLRDPKKYTRLGGAAPKGVLLIGAPGTGKTLLARAVAGEADVPFFSMSGSEFVEMIVGVGAARVRDLFKQAREHAPAIIFIDELDSIGRARGQMAFNASGEQEQTLNQILTEMDGFSSRQGIIVLAATNQPDVLDKALLRPGRFDRRVIVNLPDRVGREEILKVHTRNVPLAPGLTLSEIAAATAGLAGADLKNLVNEAALLAARRERDSVMRTDFFDALEKIVLGPARSLLMSPNDRERIAYHEAGHAILALLVPGADPVQRVTIVPRGQALGVTYQRPESDRYNYPESYLRGRIIGMLGGRAAEELVYGAKTTGAESDIEQVTQLARSMVTRWGMSDKLGMVKLAPRENPYLQGPNEYLGSKPYSEETARTIDAEVAKIIGECFNEARTFLIQHRGQLDALASALLEKETLDLAEIQSVTGLRPRPAKEEKTLEPPERPNGSRGVANV